LGITTTAGFNLEGPCKKESDYARRLLTGELANENYFTVIATVDDPAKWEEESEWYKANPNLGLSVHLDQFRAEFEEAKQKPSKRNGFKTKNLNIWTSE